MKKRRILTLLLAFCMVLTLMPTVAVAEEPTPTSITTSSLNQSDASLTLRDGNYILGEEITCSGGLTITGNVKIDLNGKTLEANSFEILSDGSLEVTDSTGNGLFKVEPGSITGGTFACKVYATSEFGITGGVFTQNAVINEFTKISGGTFNCPVQTKNKISGGTFYGDVTTTDTISGGEFFGSATASKATGGIFHGAAPNEISGIKVEYMLSYNDTEPYAVEIIAPSGVAKGPTTSTLAKGNVIEGEIVGWKVIADDGTMADFETAEEENTAGESAAAANPDEAKEAQSTYDKYGKYIVDSSLTVYANIELQIPYTLKVAKGAGGTVEPPAMDFELELINNTDYNVLTKDDLSSRYGVALDGYTINTNGEKEYKGYFSLTGTFNSLQDIFGSSGLFVRQKAKEPVSGWSFADEVWYVGANQKESKNDDGAVTANLLADVNQLPESEPATAGSYTEGYIGGLGIYKTKADPEQEREGMYRYEADFTAPAKEPPCMVFTNTYTATTGGGSGGHSYSTIYTVKFDSNGGTPVADKTLTSITGKVLEGVTAPTFEGKSFTGWTYEGAAVSDENSFYDLTKNFTTTTISLTAQWQDSEETPSDKEDGGDKPQAGKNDNEKDKPAKEADKETSEVPKTGDSSNMTMWLALILAAGAGMTAITYPKRKKADK